MKTTIAVMDGPDGRIVDMVLEPGQACPCPPGAHGDAGPTFGGMPEHDYPEVTGYEPHSMPLDIPDRVAFIEGALRMARDKLGALEQQCGMPQVGPLTLEQRVQSLEMCWVDIAGKLLPHIELLEQLGRSLSEQVTRRDTPASEVPPT